MRVERTIDSLRGALRDARGSGRTIGFVPTMGALHDGHLSLVRAARLAAGIVVVSIFVNPLQFGEHEDLAAYPRDEDADVAKLEAAGVDVVFVPSVTEMYPEDRATVVDVPPLAAVFEGASRPGHFAGVATVVTKLLNVVAPDFAFFGQKDAQQLAVVRRLVADLSIPVEIRACPTVREPDGLALSSRNAYLDPDERRRAPGLFEGLREGERVLREEGNVDSVEKTMLEVIRARGIEPDYATVVRPDDFRDFDGHGPALLVAAARVGTTRLIDNLLLEDVSGSLED